MVLFFKKFKNKICLSFTGAILFLFCGLNGLGQTPTLANNIRALQKLKTNYLYRDNYIGGIKDSKPYFKLENEHFDIMIKNKEEFLSVLKGEKGSLNGKVVYIPSNVEINLTGHKDISVPNGVTIMSDRGKAGKSGARIFTTSSGTFPLFRVSKNVKFIGLIIEGPDKEKFHNGVEHTGKDAEKLNKYRDPVSTGIIVEEDNLLVENCEIFGWTYSGILIKGGKNNIVRHSYFHHNQRYGLGYGITVDGGFAKIYANVFDYNRHDIAGTGIDGSGYEVFLNVFLANTYLHSVDMHGGGDRKDGTDFAGEIMKVYNNYFERMEGRRAILVRGVPKQESRFESNYVKLIGTPSSQKELNEGLQFRQINKTGKAIFQNNHVEM